jgi:hypothetical protein
MFRGLIDILVVAAERDLRGFLLAVAAMAVVALCAAISLAFGTFAAYVYLRALQGPILAALIVSVAYGLLAIAIWAMVAARRRAGRLRRATAAPPPPSRGNIASPTPYLAESIATQD